MSEQEKIRAFAREVYATWLKHKVEIDYWFRYNADTDINIFRWEGEALRANVYRVVGGNTNTMDLIDDFEV